ncbi:MAG: RsmE family RNA methyltransferase [Dehalococcoidia bacterium]
MHRFFLPEDQAIQDTVAISGSLAHKLRNVLRLGAGDRIIVLDNSGWEYEVELKAVHQDTAEGTVIGKTMSAGEPASRITLHQALLKGSSFEIVLQKCTEIGVSAFVPTICDRCVAVSPGSSRVDRWRKVILEAAQQSRRGKLPVLRPPDQFRRACESAGGVSVLLWEGEESRGFKSVLREVLATGPPDEVNIFVGPEGGFTPEEVDIARGFGIAVAGMGHRILRAQTAGLVAAAITFYELGEIGGGVTDLSA